MIHWQLVRATVVAWLGGQTFRMAAALAFYAILSMAPLLLIGLDITKFVLGKQAESGEPQHGLEILVGREPAEAIKQILGTLNAPGGSGFMAGVNLILFLLGSVWVFAALQDSLNGIWKSSGPARAGWARWARSQLLLFALVLGTGLLLLAVLAAGVTMTALGRHLETPRLSAGLLQGMTAAVSFVLVTCLFTLIYKLLPEAHVRWRDAWTGGLVSSLLHSLGNHAIGVYLAYSRLDSLYGAASSVVVIMLWVYYTSLGFLLGAEYVCQRHQEGVLPAGSFDRPPGAEAQR
jgi:membrane protein